MSFAELQQSRYLSYLQWKRDAFISRLEQSEKGKDYLKNAARMEQTEPDRAGLRRRMHRNGE